MASELRTWQDKLLPVMTGGLAILALLFFVGTFWNYAGLHERLARQDPDITVALDKLQAAAAPPAYQDWYMRVVLEEHAMRSRHRQNAAIVESRVWTRFMGFITGMVMVMAGCVFILGRLDAKFDGGLKASGQEGMLKTNSPGLVLAVAGTVLISMALTVPVNIEVNDKPVYIADLTVLGAAGPAVPLPPPSDLPGEDSSPRPMPSVSPPAAPSGPASRAAASLPADLSDELCLRAGKPRGCMQAPPPHR